MTATNLDHLKPRTEPVYVGERTLTLKPSTIIQAQVLAEAVTPLVEQLAAEAQGVFDAAAQDDGGGSVTRVLAALIPRALSRFTESAPKLAGAVAALLDNEVNFRALRDDGLLKDDDCDRSQGSPGYYLQSEQLRAWVAHHLTPAQAVHAVEVSARLNDYSRLGKALLAPLQGLLAKAQTPGVEVPMATPTEMVEA